MCGIAGVYSYSPSRPPASRDELFAMREAMLRRGPDGAGIWFAAHGRAALAHRRLAILDTTQAGAQPMQTPDGRLVITYNGEIYNFRMLRQELERRGHAFRSNSDTEVLLYLYREHGAEMVRRLRGMFAFAIWDEVDRTLFLARDPFGIKPLYYADSGGMFRFASQVKALLAGGAVDAAPDPAGHCGFFLWGSVPEPFTTHRAILALPAGCTMLVTPNGAQAPSRYFSVREEILRAEADTRFMGADKGQALVAEALRDSIRHHLVADVPVGVLLSAGMDSSALAAIAADFAPGRLRTVTLGFREFVGTQNDETPWAARTAAAYGAQHETRWIEQKDFSEQLEAILAAMDQPSINGVNTYFVSHAAAQMGLKVALSGVGGDELFGGYPSFRDVPRLERLPALARHAPRTARLLRRAAQALTGTRISPKYAGIFELAGHTGGAYLLRRGLYLPWELDHVMDHDMARHGLESLAALQTVEASVEGIRNPRLRVTALELGWYMRNQLLRDADWAGMAHSLEIRVPLVDAHFFRTILPALASAQRPTKAAIASAPLRALPQDLLDRAKTGFSVPVAEWIRSGVAGRERGLRGWARRVNRAPGVGYCVFALLTDGFGGRGGIALYTRDLLAALASDPRCRKLVALPRQMPDAPGDLPPKVTYLTDGLGGKLRYLGAFLSAVIANPGTDVILCAHVNLAPLATLAKLWTRAPVLLCIYGVDAWQPPRSRLARWALSQVDEYLAISGVTRERFSEWAKPRSNGHVVPNAIHLEWYRPGPKNPALLRRYGLEGRRVLLTLGRVAARERYKGFDEIIELMPDLLHDAPDLAYLIVGDGDDRPRLERKAAALNLDGRIVFAGYVDEAEKAEHFRLADAYVMPSRGEGFGFVLLEALACGIPALASKLDGGREALRDGALGVLVDPGDRDELRRGILAALSAPKGEVPQGLAHFAFPEFERRSHKVLGTLLN
jgi:asparagine synthase (glutamine-hydrolysing)